MTIAAGAHHPRHQLDGGSKEVAEAKYLSSRTDGGLEEITLMSPEQARRRAVDHRFDPFSFEAILYEMPTA